MAYIEADTQLVMLMFHRNDKTCTVDNSQVGHVNQLGHLSKTPLNLLEIHEIGSVDTFESKQQNYDQIWHMWPLYQKLLVLSHFSWLSHSPVGHCTLICDRNKICSLMKSPNSKTFITWESILMISLHYLWLTNNVSMVVYIYGLHWFHHKN